MPSEPILRGLTGTSTKRGFWKLSTQSLKYKEIRQNKTELKEEFNKIMDLKLLVKSDITLKQ